MRALVNLELHVSHACNLACESCSHYSNHGHAGNLSLDDAQAWMEPWSRRLAPGALSLLGGEPTVHPQLARFVPLVQRLWPRSHLRLVTNGFFLHRHPELPAALAAHPDACLYLSLHHESEAYLEKVRPVVALIQQWQRDFGIKARIYPSASNWTRRYHGQGAGMLPFQDGEPRSSWTHCPARTCPQLLDGAIFKCAPLAYLPMQHARYALDPVWQPYLAYAPLQPGCSDAELDAFFDREEEPACGMCPARPQRFDMPLPLRRAPASPAA